MQHKVSELEGALLDAAVAKAEGLQFRVLEEAESPIGRRVTVAWPAHYAPTMSSAEEFEPSTDWAAAGPITQRERISIVANTGYEDDGPVRWAAYVGAFGHYIDEPLPGDWAGSKAKIGPTPLIAAMRAYVASKLGDVVDLP